MTGREAAEIDVARLAHDLKVMDDGGAFLRLAGGPRLLESSQRLLKAGINRGEIGTA